MSEYIHEDRWEKRGLRSTIIFAVALAGLQVVGYFFPSVFTWGFHSLGFLPPIFLSLYLLLMVVGIGYVLSEWYVRHIDKAAAFMSAKPWYALAGAIVLFFAVAYMLRVRIPLLGDSFLIPNEYANALQGTHPLVGSRQPLTTLYFFYVVKLFGSAAYPDIMWAFVAGDLLLGIGYIVFTFLAVRVLLTDPRAQLLVFLFACVSPFVQLLFGYVEWYAGVVVVNALILLSMLLYFRGKLPFFALGIVMFLQVAVSYLGALLVSPAIGYLAYKEIRAGSTRNVLMGVSIFAVLVVGSLALLGFRFDLLRSTSEHSHVLSLGTGNDQYQAYSLISPYHFIDIANLIVLLAPGAIFLLLANRPIRNWREWVRDDTVIVLTCIITALAGVVAIAKFDMPMATDWDIVAPFSFFLVVLASYVALRSITPTILRMVGLIVLSTALTSTLYYSLNASAEPAVARKRLFLDTRVASHSGYYQTLFHLATYYQITGQTDSMTALCRRYVHAFPTDEKGFSNLVKAYREYGTDSITSIERTYEQWLAVTARRDYVRREYTTYCAATGTALYKNKQLVEAATLFQKAIQLDSSSAQLYNNLGLVYYDQGDTSQAVSLYQKALDLKPDYALAYKNLAVVYLDRGDIQTGVELSQKAVEVDSTFVEGYEQLANAQMHAGNEQAGIATYQQAARLGSQLAQQLLTKNGYRW